ncbi:MAG: hypothetical protein FWE67_02945 [Planctomycetaceae bacterium]|nr:hypothetical protein [Planctomycetaceae bacterium]
MKKIWTILIFCFRYRSVILSIDTLPAAPLDWHDSVLVKQFVLGCIDSPFAVKLVQTTETDWDDKRLAEARLLLLNTAVWETAWHFFEDRFGTITVPFLERVKNFLRFRLAERGSQCGDVNAESVIEVLSLISLLYQLRKFFHKQ